MGQYEINQFLRRLLAQMSRGLQPEFLAKLDVFRRGVKWPRRQKGEGASNLKFEERLVDKPGKHIRMFAAECLQAILTMCLFVELQPAIRTMLPEEVECLQLLGRILYILRSGNRAVAQLAVLATLVLKHHDLFVRLYPGCAKIKPHLLFHILEAMAYFKVNLSCFSTERKHKDSKHRMFKSH